MYIKKKPDSVESDGIAVKTIKRGWMKGLYKDCIKPELDGTLTLRYRTQYRLSKKYTFFQTRYKEQFADYYWVIIKQYITVYLTELKKKTSDQQHGTAISESIKGMMANTNITNITWNQIPFDIGMKKDILKDGDLGQLYSLWRDYNQEDEKIRENAAKVLQNKIPGWQNNKHTFLYFTYKFLEKYVNRYTSLPTHKQHLLASTVNCAVQQSGTPYDEEAQKELRQIEEKKKKKEEIMQAAPAAAQSLEAQIAALEAQIEKLKAQAVKLKQEDKVQEAVAVLRQFKALQIAALKVQAVKLNKEGKVQEAVAVLRQFKALQVQLDRNRI